MEYYRHHYVPQFYLNGFTDTEGKLHVADKIRRKRWVTTPAKTAWAPEFYKIDAEGVDPMAIEKAFSNLEGEFATVLRETLATRKLPTGESFNVLMNFVATMHTRVPHVRSAIDKFAGEILGKLGKMAFRGPEGAKRLREDPENASMTDEEMEQLQAFIASDEYTISVDQTWHVQTMIDSIGAILPALSHRNWSLWTVGDGLPDLVCSDRPVVLWSPNSGFMLGLATPETMLTLPLDGRTMLASRLEEVPGTYVMDADDVDTMNMLRAENATQVYASTQDWACAFGGAQAYLDALIYHGKSDLGPFPRE